MPKDLRDAVVVITGASSGIGRATAVKFAEEGAKLVLASRSKSNLKETAEETEEIGAETLVVQCDVSDEDDVDDLARSAVKRFGRIDVWVNDAGVGAYAPFEEMPSDAFRQVIETNLFGSIYGARAALRAFRKQRHGVLINISSQLAFGGVKYNSAYAISKYGLRALSDVLRQELLDTDIHVCTVYPASTDTPFFQHAANFTGRKAQPLGSVSKPEEVAEAIVAVARDPKPDTLIGSTGYMTEPLHWFAPKTHARVLAKKAEKDQLGKEPERKNKGILFRPSDYASVRGGWTGDGMGAKPVAFALGATAAAGGIWFAWNRRRRASETTKSAA
jgi:NAD(P)-dependent dehydrogenase (short-subunit alcohol dehydrogenase family)